MPRDSSGTYTLPVTAFVSASVIISGDVNSDFSDIATALTQSLATTGVSTMTGPLKIASGTVSAPGLSFNADTGTGFYLAAANSLGMAITSVSVLLFNASATAIWGFDHVFGSVVSFASLVAASGGITSTVTVTGMVDISGGMIVGYDGVPAIDTIRVATSTLGFDFNSGTAPRLNLDTNSRIFYNRASNFFGIEVSSVTAQQLSTTNNYYSGYLQFPEITAPTSAPTSKVHIYAKDNGAGVSRMYYKDDNGAEIPMGGPGYWEQIGTFTVTTSVTTIQLNFDANYSRIVVVGTSIAPASTITNALIAQAYDSVLEGQPYQYDGMIIGLTDGANDEVNSANGSPLRDPGTWTAGNECCFFLEFTNENNTGFKGIHGYGSSHTESITLAQIGVNSTTEYTPANRMSFFFIIGQIRSGNFRIYGQIAN